MTRKEIAERAILRRIARREGRTYGEVAASIARATDAAWLAAKEQREHEAIAYARNFVHPNLYKS